MKKEVHSLSVMSREEMSLKGTPEGGVAACKDREIMYASSIGPGSMRGER